MSGRPFSGIATAFLLVGASLAVITASTLMTRNSAEVTLQAGFLMDPWLVLAILAPESKNVLALLSISLTGAFTGAGIGILRRERWARPLAASLAGASGVVWLVTALFMMLAAVQFRALLLAAEGAASIAAAFYLMTAQARAAFGDTTPARPIRRAGAVLAIAGGALLLVIWMVATVARALQGLR
jgi:hypothetical protein